jgi:hypothetical protein
MNPNRLVAQGFLDQIVGQIILSEQKFAEGKLSGKIYSLALPNSLVDESKHVIRFSFSPELYRQRKIFYEPHEAMVVTSDSWIAGDQNEWTATVEGLQRFEDHWDELGIGLDSRIADFPHHYSLRPNQKVNDMLFHVCSEFPPLSGRLGGWPEIMLSSVILACNVTKIDDIEIKDRACKLVELSGNQGTFSIVVIPELQYRIIKMVLSLDRNQIWFGQRLEDAGFDSLQFSWELSEFDDLFENFVITISEDHQALDGSPQNRVFVKRIRDLSFETDNEWITRQQSIPEGARVSVIGQSQLEHFYHDGRALPQWDEVRVGNLSQLHAISLDGRHLGLLNWKLVSSLGLGVIGAVLVTLLILRRRNDQI